MNQISKPIVIEFPVSTTTSELKIAHLVCEARTRNRAVVGMIEDINVHVYPNDKISEIVSWLEEYNKYRNLQVLLPNGNEKS